MKRFKLVLDKRRKAIRLGTAPLADVAAGIADVLNERGHCNSIGTPFNADSVERQLAEKRVKKRGKLAVEEARLPGGSD